MPLKTSSGKWKWGNIERDSKKELVQTVYGIWKKNGSKGSFSDFWNGRHVKEGQMQSFSQFLQEASNISTVDETTLNNILDNDLKIVITWLFKTFGYKKGTSNEKFIDKIEYGPGDKKEDYFLKIFSNQSPREVRRRQAFQILESFNDGPLFVKQSKPRPNDLVKFLYFTNLEKDQDARGRIEGFLSALKDKYRKNYRQIIPKDVAFYKNSHSSLAPSQQKFRLTLYEIRYSDLIQYFNVTEGRKPSPKIESLKSLCTVAYRIAASTTIQFSGEKIRNSVILLDKFIRKLPSSIGETTESAFVLNKLSPSNSETVYQTLLDSLQDLIPEENSGEYLMYRTLFHVLFGEKSSLDNFRMNDLKKSQLQDSKGKFIPITFGNALEESKHIGAVISELLIPFLLVKGYSKIDSKNIILGMDPTDEIVSVEWPTSAINGLTDYDVIFANTAKGRKFAISAKYEEGNKTCLIGRMFSCKEDLNSFRTNAFKIMLDLSRKIGETNHGKNNYVTKTIWEIARRLNLDFDLPGEFTYEGVVKNEYELPDDLKMNIEEVYPERRGATFQKAISQLPYSLTVLFERMVSNLINSDESILTDIYNMVFNYYHNAEFQQIELSKDLNLKYIPKKDLSKVDVRKLIEIVNVGSLKNEPGKSLNQSHVLGIHLM